MFYGFTLNYILPKKNSHILNVWWTVTCSLSPNSFSIIDQNVLSQRSVVETEFQEHTHKMVEIHEASEGGWRWDTDTQVNC